MQFFSNKMYKNLTLNNLYSESTLGQSEIQVNQGSTIWFIWVETSKQNNVYFEYISSRFRIWSLSSATVSLFRVSIFIFCQEHTCQLFLKTFAVHKKKIMTIPFYGTR